MNRFLISAAVAATFATPALAQDAPASASAFNGAHIGGTIGVGDDDIFGADAFTYGVDAGYDFNLGGAVVGVTGELQDTDETDREFNLGGRVGGQIGSNVLIYGGIGYSNLKIVDGFKIDGVRFSGGVEVAPHKNVYIKAEQRYTNYELGAELWQTVVGVGIRF